MNRVRTVAAGSVACAALLATLPAAAFAAKHRPAVKPAGATGNVATSPRARAAFLFGTLQSVSSASATVNGTGGGTVTLSANTRFVARSYEAATGGLKVNDQVAVLARSGKAAVVEYDTKAFAFAEGKLSGTLALNGTNLTITPSTGAAITVAVTSATTYIVNGARQNAAPALGANTIGRVLVTRFTDGTVVARLVAIGAETPSPRAHAVALTGTVNATSAGSSTLTVTTATGTVTVTITGATRFRVNGKASTTGPAFTANQKVVVIATKNADGTYTALLVATRP